MRHLLALPLLCLLASSAPAQTSGEVDVWTRRLPETFPGRRSYGFLAFDDNRRTVLRFGGWNGNLPTNDTWSWDGANWTQIVPANRPPRRFAHGNLAYQPERDRMLVFGGRGNSGMLGDTWEWDGTNWLLRSPTRSPSPRANHNFVYDRARAEVVLFGGVDAANAPLGDTWVWDGNEWHERSPENAPSARLGGLMGYDVERQRAVLFGGSSGGVRLGDTWEWDGTNWSERLPVTNPPARALGGLAFDGNQENLVLFGGWDAAGNWLGDLWEWDGSDWSTLSTLRRPSARCCAGMTFDEARGRMLMYGGCDNNVVQDTWELYPGAEARFRELGGRPTIPRLAPAPEELPYVGEVFELELRAEEEATWALCLAGLGARRHALTPGGFPLLVGRLFARELRPLAAGHGAWSLSIPPDPGLMGTVFHVQFASTDGHGGIAFSNPGQAVVGAR